MNSQLTGAPKTVVNIFDTSNLVTGGVGGYICVQGETLRGPLGKSQFVSSTGAFTQLYGDLHPNSPFPAYCQRLLAGGVKLYVGRAAHYTDPADPATAVGVKATATYAPATGVAYSLTVRAKYVGAGYNGTVVSLVAASSLVAGNLDLIVSVPNGPSVTVFNLPATLTATDVARINATLAEFEVTTYSGTLVAGKVTLAGGAQDVTLITSTDYAGNRAGQTGWYSFSLVPDAMRVANIHRPDPAYDATLLAYVVARGDMRCHLAFPALATASGMDDYRLGQGAYSYSPIDSLYASYWGGGLNAPLPNDASSNIVYPGIVEFLIQRSLTDADVRQGPWYSAAGYDHKATLPNRGLVYNLLSPDNYDDYDRVYGHGINALVGDRDENGAALVMPWGNRSAVLDNTKVTSKENVCDLLIYLVRSLKPYMKRGQFKPDSPALWKSIYRNVRPFIEQLEKREAIVPGEGTYWFWQGDQDATTRAEAVYNTQNELAQGKYRARFVFLPVAATEFIELALVATDANQIAATIAGAAI